MLTPAELAQLWRGLGEGQFADIVRLLLLTGQRRNEIGGLRWSEIDLAANVIRLPPERTKNKRPHEVPLAPQAREIIERQRRRNDREFLFGLTGFTGWAEGKAALDRRLRLPPWRLHDLRRTCATGLAEIGVLPHIIEAILNHVSGHRAGVQSSTIGPGMKAKKMRDALAKWAAHVAEIALIVGVDCATGLLLTNRRSAPKCAWTA